MKENENIPLPKALEPARSYFLRFAAPDKQSCYERRKNASKEELEAITITALQLLQDDAKGLLECFDYADKLKAQGQEDAAARIRAFVESIMPVSG